MRHHSRFLRLPVCLGLFLAHAAVCLALVYLGLVLILPHYLSQGAVEGLLARELGKKVPETRVDLGGAKVEILPFPHISLENLSVKLPGRALVQIQRLDGYPDLASLLSGSPQPGGFHIQDLRVIMGLPKKTVEWARPEEPKGLSALLGALPPVEGTIRNGELQIFRDTVIHMHGIRADVDIAEKVRLHLQTETNFSSKLSLSLESNAQRTKVGGTLRTEELRLELLAPYLPPDVARWAGASSVGMDADFSFSGGDQYQASVRLKPSWIDLITPGGKGRIRINSGRTTITRKGAGTKIRLYEIDLADPRLNLTGSLNTRKKDQGLNLEFEAGDVRIPSAAATCRKLFPDQDFIESFSIILEGRLPWTRIKSSGKDKEAVLANLSILGRVEEGKVDLPKPDIMLHRVGGTFHIVENALSLNDLSADFGKSEITAGRAAFGLEDGVDPLSLYLESRLDLAQTVDLLDRTLDIPEFQRHLRDIETLRGNADATYSMAKKGEELEWDVELKHLDLRAKHAGFPLPFSLRRGRLSFAQKTLRFIGLRGTLGNSSIGRLEGNIRFGSRIAMRLDGGKAELALEELAAAVKDLPVLAGRRKTLETLEGRMDLERFSLTGPLPSPDQWNFSASGSLPRFAMTSPFLEQSLEGSVDSLSGDVQGLSWSGLRLSSSSSRIFSHGELTLEQEDFRISSAQGSLRGDLRSPEILDQLYTLLPVPEPLQIKAPLSFSQGRFQWRGENNFSLRTDFELAGGTTGRVNASAKASKYRLHDLQLRHGDRSVTIEASLENNRLNTYFDGKLAMQDLRTAFRHPGTLRGELEGDFHVELQMAPFRFVDSKGTLRVNSLNLPERFGIPLLELDRVHLEGKGKEITAHTLHLLLNHRPIDLSGSVNITPEANILDMKLRAGKLDYEWLKAVQDMAEKEGSADGTVNLSRIKGTADVMIDAFRLGDLNIAPVQGAVDISRDKLTLLISEMGLCQLDPLGQIVFGVSSISAELSANIRDQELARTSSCLGGGENLISGKYALNLRTGGEGESLSELKSNNKGKLRFQAREGRIYRITVLAKLLALLNASEILFGKVPDLQEDGLGYNSIDIEGDIQGQVLQLNKAVVDGKSLKLAATGDIDFATQRLNLIVLVSPLKTVDRIISWIPIVNYIMDNTLVTIPFQIFGKMKDPAVVPMSPQAVGSEVFGIMKRTLSLPFKVLQPFLPDNEGEEENGE
ncbi:MAG: AsmA-like C-terminal domain-containing protein [Desulfohalobiaceae bacterium]